MKRHLRDRLLPPFASPASTAVALALAPATFLALSAAPGGAASAAPAPAAAGAGEQATPAPEETSHYTRGRPSRDGIGKFYLGREISHVMGHQGIGWLERSRREKDELPDRVVEEMELKPDEVVADIGAGSGYFTFRMAPRVPRGKVLAVDIQPEMIAFLEKRKARLGATNVQTVLGTVEDPNLPPGIVDVVLFVDAYHEFSHPREMMEALVVAMKPGGRVVQVEYKGEDPAIPIKPLHKMTQAQAKKEMAAVGLQWVETKTFLPSQHFMVFRKPGGDGSESESEGERESEGEGEREGEGESEGEGEGEGEGGSESEGEGGN